MSQTSPDPQQPARDDALPTEAELASAREGRVRRAPRYRRFVQVGALLGAVVGVVAVLVLPSVPTEAGLGTVAFFVGLTGAVLGAVLGAVVAAVVDRRSRR
ncbi:histidine kinase [Actinotalea ferrariae]|uniref:histidine kinase n=1 Tax=Actinotalea ferrariae TaxID=1386098 RepID=UPI001C8B4BB3|nr:histidine kinase [Actinotalea ferrariae]MBX9243908.1 histidine kinase [Actinotalea ferrariae]